MRTTQRARRHLLQEQLLLLCFDHLKRIAFAGLENDIGSDHSALAPYFIVIVHGNEFVRAPADDPLFNGNEPH